MQQDQCFLKRDYVAALGNRIRWLPFAFAASDAEDNSNLSYKFYAFSNWSDLQQANFLTIDCLAIACKGSRARSADLRHVGNWENLGTLTDFQVVELTKQGQLLFLCASAQGHLSTQLVQLPSHEEELVQGDINGGSMEPWIALHNGPVASVDLSPDSQHALTAGEDGALCVLPLSASSEAAVRRVRQGGSGTSYVSAKWAGANAFVAAPSGGGLELWDMRQAHRQATCLGRTPQSWGLTGCPAAEQLRGPEMRITSVSVHPSQPNTCATGSTGGCVAVWDLRMERAPLACSLPGPAAGDVWQVMFESGEAFASTRPGLPTPLLFSTETGILGRASYEGGTGPATYGAPSSSLADVGWSVQPLCTEAFAVTAFDVEPSGGQDIVATTDQECVLYLQRLLPGMYIPDEEDEMVDAQMAYPGELSTLRAGMPLAVR